MTDALPAAVGVANHNGWAHLVSMAIWEDAPVVLDRRRVTLVAPELPSMPHEHNVRDLTADAAQALVETVRQSAAAHAREALATLAAELSPSHRLTAMALRQSPFGALPASVAEVLDYAPFIYAADAMLYLDALAGAAEALDLTRLPHPKGAEYGLAAARLGISSADADALIKALGKPLGPPWSQEHQRAAAAAIGALP